MYHFPRFVSRETQYHENPEPSVAFRSLLEARFSSTFRSCQLHGAMAAEPPAHIDDELVRSLQQRLKPGRGPLPKPHIVRAAIALAKDDRQEPTPAWLTTHGVPTMGDAKTRVLTLRARIVDEGLLETETQSGPALASSPSPAPLLPEKLLVTGEWVNEHVPVISDFTGDTLAVSPGGRHATRELVVHLHSGEEDSITVTYDLPPASGESAAEHKQRNDMHRRREQERATALGVPFPVASHYLTVRAGMPPHARRRRCRSASAEEHPMQADRTRGRTRGDRSVGGRAFCRLPQGSMGAVLVAMSWRLCTRVSRLRPRRLPHEVRGSHSDGGAACSLFRRRHFGRVR